MDRETGRAWPLLTCPTPVNARVLQKVRETRPFVLLGFLVPSSSTPPRARKRSFAQAKMETSIHCCATEAEVPECHLASQCRRRVLQNSSGTRIAVNQE